jgi:hypothetical protein
MIRVVHPGFQILDPDPDFLPIPDLGVKRHRSRIRIRNTVYYRISDTGTGYLDLNSEYRVL